MEVSDAKRLKALEDENRQLKRLLADALHPIAQAIIDVSQIKQGESVLDVGSRSGNWTLLAAEAGAWVTGIDFSPPFLEVARAKLKESYPNARFELTDVAKLPFADGSFDAVIDVVTLMFGADREKAVAEMSRGMKPNGRIVWTGRVGGGAVAEVTKLQIDSTADVLSHAPFLYSYWGDEDDMRELFGAQGFDIHMIKNPMVNTGPSPREFMEGVDQTHPITEARHVLIQRTC